MATTFTARQRKDPAAVLDYAHDLRAWLRAGEGIASYQVTVTGATLLAHAETEPGVVTAWLSAGADGQDATFALRVTTDAAPQPRIDERTARIPIGER